MAVVVEQGIGKAGGVRSAARTAAVIAVFTVAAYTLRDKLPDFADVGSALRDADPAWLVTAGFAMLLSMAMFARQHRRLLTAVGITLPRHRALALSFSRSAMSISLPAGAAASAGFAFRQFRAGGADRRTATSLLVLSAAVSAAGLVVLSSTGMLATVLLGVSTQWRTHPLLVVGAGVALAGTIVLLARFASRVVAPRHWLLALAAAVANWSTDLLCLVAVSRAFAVPVGIVELGAIYVAVQLVRQIPLTPGGIGVIEAGLLAGLSTAGVADASAAATVLTYRVFSCWLIIPIGALGWLVLRSRSSQPDTTRALGPSPETP